MDDFIFISGGIRARDGRLLQVKDKSELLKIMFELCQNRDYEFIGTIGFQYEFMENFSTAGPRE